MARLSRQDAVAAREAKLEEIASRLEAAVEELTTGEDWCRAMTFAARFRSRSFGNVLLICAQHSQAHAEGRVPESFPTYVAGFRQWKELGRSVNKGQRGYMIYAEGLHRGVGEVEAESVAMMITATYGMDAGGYSVPYVSAWSTTVEGTKPVEVVRATGELARKTALAILATLPEPSTGDGDPPGLDRRADFAPDLPAAPGPDLLPGHVRPRRELSRPAEPSVREPGTASPTPPPTSR